ncbi:unnamed protein product [Paramecium octaurelia]|uniref:Uncharacterized protein n=1 Tax=Paramecium octaurelia TaxID=43137 RepID=A0A8S1T0K0_PAROT|nr:unnamed protein product [Paramecium octaurelia]
MNSPKINKNVQITLKTRNILNGSLKIINLNFSFQRRKKQLKQPVNIIKFSNQLSIHDQESLLDHDNFEIPHQNWKFLSETSLQSAYSIIDEGNQIEVYCNTKGDQVIFFGRYQHLNKDGLWQTQYCLKQQQEFLPIGGGLYKNSVKIDKWVELHKSFERDQFIIFSGFYENGIRIGFWKILVLENQVQQIGGGYFDHQNGLKNGMWTELHVNYDKECQVITTGEYKDGIKQGYWKIKQKTKFYNKFYVIGGGNFNNQGQKQGKWIDLHQEFDSLCQVTYQGDYVNGIKFGLWEAYNKNQIIAQGVYGQVGEKIGKWTELIDNYYELNQVFQIGIYEKGKKSKQWKIVMQENYSKNIINIGGGTYDIDGEKIGFWVEPHLNFYEDCQIIMTGDYYLGQRIGNWEIYLRRYKQEQYKSIGEQNYNQSGVKIGRWDELEGYYDLNHQLINSGIYENGKKHGRWDIKYRKCQEEFAIIGGGCFEYNEKIGMWLEPIEYFNQNKLILFEGCYQKNKMYGWWNMYRKKSYGNELIGGGYYEDQYGTKNGVWNEIEEISEFPKELSVIFRQYLNGMKLYPITKQFII